MNPATSARVPEIARLDDDCLRLVFKLVSAYEIAYMASTGDKGLRARIFRILDYLHIPLDPTRRIFWPDDFLSQFTALKTFELGNPVDIDGPYMPRIDLKALPRTLTRLGLHISNGQLALLNIPSSVLAECHDATQPFDLSSMFPSLSHLAWKNGYNGDGTPLGAYQCCLGLSKLPLVSLTMSPININISDFQYLPSTLIHLKILCTGWPIDDGQIDLPTNLETLDIRGLNIPFAPTWPKNLVQLRLEYLALTEEIAAAILKSLGNLPPTLYSLHLVSLALTIPIEVIRSLPRQLDQLRLYIKAVKSSKKTDDSLADVSVYASVPRTLRTLHLFCSSLSPEYGASYDELPRGIVDFCCDRIFPISAPISSSTSISSATSASIQTKTGTPVSFPPHLVRVRANPPKKDFSPDELLSVPYQPNTSQASISSKEQIDNQEEDDGAGAGAEKQDKKKEKSDSSSSMNSFFGPTLKEFVTIFDPIIFEMTETLSKVERLDIRRHPNLASAGDYQPKKLFEMLTSLRLKEISLSIPGNVVLWQSMANLGYLSSAKPEAEVPKLLDHRKLLEEVELYHGMDGFYAGNWKWSHTGFPNLKTLRVNPYFFHSVINYLPDTLTELDMVDFKLDDEETSYTTIIEGRAPRQFPLLPRNLLKLRMSVAYLQEGSIFAILPKNLVELHIQEKRMLFTDAPNPTIPVEELFFLPPSIRRLTLPSYGLHIYTAAHVLQLHEFCASRPQLASFNLWPTKTCALVGWRNSVFANEHQVVKTWKLPCLENSLSYDPLALRTSIATTPEFATAALPSMSLEVAVRDSAMNLRTAPTTPSKKAEPEPAPPSPPSSSTAPSSSSSSTSWFTALFTGRTKSKQGKEKEKKPKKDKKQKGSPPASPPILTGQSLQPPEHVMVSDRAGQPDKEPAIAWVAKIERESH